MWRLFLLVTYKIFLKALQTKEEEQLDPQLREYQGGFRKGCSSVKLNVNLKSNFSYLKHRNKKFVVTSRKPVTGFLNHLIQILKELGLDNKTRVIIQQTLNDITSKVKSG